LDVNPGGPTRQGGRAPRWGRGGEGLERGTDLVYGDGLEPRVHVETPREVLRERELLGVRHPRRVVMRA